MKLFCLAVILFSALITGCATGPKQANVDMDLNLIPKDHKIGLFVSPVPKITTSFPGAHCLLCLGAAAIANSSLTKQVETFSADELAKTKELLTHQFKAKGYEVVIIDTLIPERKLPKAKPAAGSTIKKNYARYKTLHGVDQLLVVNFYTVGVVRPYSGYIATGVPQARIDAHFHMIDVNRNAYTFYSPINIVKSADGEWDTPPKFPGLTNAFYQAEEEAADLLKKPLNN